MIKLPNRKADHWMNRCFSLQETWTPIIAVLARKASLPPPEDQGTFVCPYCYLSEPHSAEFHDSLADKIETALREGIVLLPLEKAMLVFIASQCRNQGARKQETDRLLAALVKAVGSESLPKESE